ncbi:DUF3696 domain-containing protein [Hymenobacter rubripertinctus]|uniref:DUF3696 domain-containing protein n=1 Tax=Hymenobacter rubripertinctus TaxID=2029981 RepID=A0A418QR33_9BACT|nr:DUF3696 domain-containing protein [Hymenobacter rubripertinctus]RIY07561.1 DUF3696 domain-containing protein [Hymenobacter rubripertinctus]
MLNSLRIQNFKSWQDTGDIQFGSITGFFGTNSSGKTSILQFLLMLKQTVESSDRAQILNLGDERSYVELGTMHDILHNHDESENIRFALGWQEEAGSEDYKKYHFSQNTPYVFSANIKTRSNNIYLEEFFYKIHDLTYRIYRENTNYRMIVTNRNYKSFSEQMIGKIDKFYYAPFLSNDYFVEVEPQLATAYTSFNWFFGSIFYLGPLRANPKRLYVWGGSNTDDVGKEGEKTIAAILASKNQNKGTSDNILDLEQHVAYWLKELGLIHSFEVRPIAPNRKEYEVRIKRTAESAEVFLTDVGFGVSQLLPVLVLLFYVPEGSTIILEQPEIHLHPAVQAGLADVFIDAIKRRNVQIILESHSEHLLQRLQRRLAEEALPTDQVKLYFTDFVGAASTLTPLDLDEYGNIRNWPKNFFGDTMGEAAAMMEAEMKRKMQS